MMTFLANETVSPVPCLVPQTAENPFLRRGRLLRRRLEADPRQEYLVHVPRHTAAEAPVLVSVHGISRNAVEHGERFSRVAKKHGIVVIAPLFPEDRFPDYQRLGRSGRGARADFALDAILCEVGRLSGAATERFHLTGFSGGAQFAHRYAMAHPRRVATLVLCAAGWYTFPDARSRFPYGIKACPRLPSVVFNPAAFLRIPTLVAVGDEDAARDAALNASARVDRQQGRDRVERAQRWLSAMRAAADEFGFRTRYEFELLPRSGHDFEDCARRSRGDLAQRVMAWMFDDAAA